MKIVAICIVSVLGGLAIFLITGLFFVVWDCLDHRKDNK